MKTNHYNFIISIKGMLISFLFFLSLNAYSTNYYVSKNGGNSDGLSWTNAFTDLQTALATASNGDVIYIAKGTYIPHQSDSSVSFVIPDSVEIYGGLVGDESIIDQAVLDAKVLLQHFGDGGQTVRRAGRVGDDVVLIRVVVAVVDSDYDGNVLALRGGGNDDFLRASLDVLGCTFASAEEAGGFDDDLDTQLAPG